MGQTRASVWLHEVGTSKAKADLTRRREGNRLVTAGSKDHSYRTDVFVYELARADVVVDKIIAANQ